MDDKFTLLKRELARKIEIYKTNLTQAKRNKQEGSIVYMSAALDELLSLKKFIEQ